MRKLHNVTLEMSLKPFRSTEPQDIRAVCRELFTQWAPLADVSEGVSVMLWTADGSEILEYNGRMEDELEWARYVGGATNLMHWNRNVDPHGISLHTTNYLYCDQPPVITYGILRQIVALIKEVGEEITGKPVRVGATFDPGPEFAQSPFKYERHPEILMGASMGAKSFVCCYGVLHADDRPYAGFPEGIPEGTPFGTFLGRQCRHFLPDMGFDYVWMSNGFGFGSETWGTTGAIFDGETFYPEKIEVTQQRITDFWRLFRAECSHRVETRGTNLSCGIDFATDAVNIKAIYEGDYDLLPPPNSPWAALDGDFGLELAGYMSRIAELPGEDYLFRFYIHDPWWMNSPWLDRYERQPHDIYLPLAVARMNEQGETVTPNYLNILTLDDSLGEMPRQVPQEVIPHLMQAYRHAPDAPSPFVWVYPFDEYSNLTSGRVGKSFFEDWFMRGAINHGFPLSTVISTASFLSTLAGSPDLYRGSVLVIPVPVAGSPLSEAVEQHVLAGGKVMLYGSVQGADERLMSLLNLDCSAAAIEGELQLQLSPLVAEAEDVLEDGSYAGQVHHSALSSDGGVDTVLRDEQDRHTQLLMSAEKDGLQRVAALYRSAADWQGGALVWIRGSNTSRRGNAHILLPLAPDVCYPAEKLVRMAAELFGYSIALTKNSAEDKSPVVMVHRHENGFIFSGYNPNTTVDIRLRFPLGAPLLLGYETKVSAGSSAYRLPRAWNMACRAFVAQEQSGTLSYTEIPAVSFQIRKRQQISGLKNATVYVMPRTGYEDATELKLNSPYPHLVGEPLDYRRIDTPWGPALEARGVTGTLVISERHLPDPQP